MYDFIKLLNGAELVITNSFHGAALSINLGKQFYCFRRFSDNDNKSQNSRIYDLLELFDIQNRLIDEHDEIIDLLKKQIDYSEVHNKLNKMREKSKNTLLNVIDTN